MSGRRTEGALWEEKASEWLKTLGFEILERNFTSRHGEIDIIARENDSICFVEVKYRKNALAGDPASAVTPRKQERILHAARVWLMMRQLPEDTACRFDVVSILGGKFRLIRDAFGYR